MTAILYAKVDQILREKEKKLLNIPHIPHLENKKQNVILHSQHIRNTFRNELFLDNRDQAFAVF